MAAGPSSSSSSSTLPSPNPWFNISQVLNNISAGQIPDDEHTVKCHEIGSCVIEVLEKELGGAGLCGIVLIAGSYGKCTSITGDSDYDIVVFFADLEPPFNKILSDMEDAIKGNATSFKAFEWKARSSIHVSFEVEGMQFDVTPATQLVDFMLPKTGKWFRFIPSPPPMALYPTIQYLKTMDKIRKLEDPVAQSYLYSSSLSIDALMFVQAQNPFVHSVIRLCKHWARHVNLKENECIRGKSVVMETLAIHAGYALSQKEMDDAKIIKAFSRFLKYFARVDDLRLHFFYNYTRSDVPDSVFEQNPLVLDPTNPFNNLLSSSNFPKSALSRFQECAQITLGKLDSWRTPKGSDADFKKMLFQFDI